MNPLTMLRELTAVAAVVLDGIAARLRPAPVEVPTVHLDGVGPWARPELAEVPTGPMWANVEDIDL